ILSYAAYPSVKVLVNTKKTRFFETVYGFMVLPLTPGLNEIEIMPVRTGMANLFFFISLGLWTGIIFYLFFRKKIKKGKNA
ncbi:MAG: hypothetical protein PHF84_04625, partial [bacterium]|nr:hypothetical protein [bacterium]